MTRGLIGMLIAMVICTAAIGQHRGLTEGLSDIESIEQINLPLQDNYKLLAETRSQADDVRRPLKFAKAINTFIQTQQDGVWEDIPGDISVWRTRIQSESAYSINLTFEDFQLPASAEMYIYDIHQRHVIGPITAADNDIHRQWWSPIIPHDEVIVEISVHTSEAAELKTNITQVNHDFSGFGAVMSGSCNIDVICGAEDGLPFADQYRDLIKSVGMYTLQGIEVCSGSLINTTRNDCTPYFLTAFHCEITESNAASIVVYWNYENTTCRQPNSAESGMAGDGPLTQFNSGSTLIAGYDASDVTLLLLDDDVNPEFDPFFAGWEVQEEVFDTVFSIHHPNSEEKRISVDYDQTTPYADEFFMRVEGWELGTTEGGSSGAPLFNKEKRIIGQLTGGLAACGNTDFDDFGMLKLSWEGGGTPGTRLKDWLDPDNTGVTQWDGRACRDVVSISPPSISICKLTQPQDTLSIVIGSGYLDGATLSIADLPEGVNASLSDDTISGTAEVLLIIDGSDVDTDIVDLIGVQVSDAFTTTTTNVLMAIDADIPAIPTLMAPADGLEDINFDINFDWASTGDFYLHEIAEDAAFTKVIRSTARITDSELRVTGLEPATTYYWRTRSFNDCGQSDFSEVFAFTTGDIACRQYLSTDGPIEIIEERNVITSTITVPDDQIVADVNLVNIQGTHTWISDLEFRLIGPNGAVADLIINGCEDEDDFRVSFDDESENINLDCPFVGDKAYRPLEPLHVFDNISSQGDWTLEVTDNVFLDGGSLANWTLELCLVKSNEPQPKTMSVSPSMITICENTFEAETITINLGGSYEEEVNVSLYNGVSGEQLGETFSASSLAPIVVDLFDVESLFFYETPSIVVAVGDSTGFTEQTIPVAIEVDDIEVDLLMPMDADTGVVHRPVFSWDTGADAVLTNFMLLDQDGEILLDTAVTGVDSLELPFRLDRLTTYQWRLNSIGLCSPLEVSDTYSFTTSTTISIAELQADGISIYPNPAQDRLFIYAEDAWDDRAVFRLYDISGRRLIEQPLGSVSERISLIDVRAGMYLFEIENGQKKYVDRLVIMD